MTNVLKQSLFRVATLAVTTGLTVALTAGPSAAIDYDEYHIGETGYPACWYDNYGEWMNPCASREEWLRGERIEITHELENWRAAWRNYNEGVVAQFCQIENAVDWVATIAGGVATRVPVVAAAVSSPWVVFPLAGAKGTCFIHDEMPPWEIKVLQYFHDESLYEAGATDAVGWKRLMGYPSEPAAWRAP